MKTLINEALAFLASWKTELRGKRDFGAVLEADGLCAIAGDIDTARETCARLAFSARVADDEGITRLEDALANGIDATDAPAIKAALRHFRCSRATDQRLAQKLSS